MITLTITEDEAAALITALYLSDAVANFHPYAELRQTFLLQSQDVDSVKRHLESLL